jgi:NAD(P)-dependent dehydrogenase (short-subunit alcohol dehydrogenase family)
MADREPSDADPATVSGLAGRSALVTGGASGLGRETARRLAAAGARVLVADLDTDGGKRVAEEIDGAFLRTNVSSLEQNEAAVAEAVDRFGGLDLAFLNAGVSTGCGVGEDFDPALYRRAMGANLDGVVYGVHAALPALRDGDGGAIVATSSLAGLTAVPMDPIYAANKHGVVGLVRSLGPGLAAEGVRINAVCPGFADTAIIADFKDELERSGMPIIPADDVARVVIDLFAGDRDGECWFVQPGRIGAFEFRNLPGPRA